MKIRTVPKEKDAVDFAICTSAGKLHRRLDLRIPFRIFSKDKFALFLQATLRAGGREVYIDPNDK